MNYPSQIVGLPLAEYLRLPAVGASTLATLLERCPYAAWWESPLNPNREQDDSKASDKGTVAHEILLEGSEDSCCVIDPNDYPAEKTGAIPNGWTNKAIRLARDNARALGKIPILAEDMSEIRAMVESARKFIESLKTTEPAVWRAFQADGGESELTLLFEVDGILCRARPDRISADRKLVVHVKSTERSAEPDSWGRTHLTNQGLYMTAAHYRRAVAEVFGVEESDHKFLVIEQQAPYLPSLVGTSPAHFALGAAKTETAMKEWRRCVERNHWPAYPSACVYPELPAYEQLRWEEREVLSFEERLLLGSQA